MPHPSLQVNSCTTSTELLCTLVVIFSVELILMEAVKKIVGGSEATCSSRLKSMGLHTQYIQIIFMNSSINLLLIDKYF